MFVQPASADVAVLANRTVAPITVEVVRSQGLPQGVTIPSGDSKPVFFQGALQVRFGELLTGRQYPLKHGSAYYFTRSADSSTLQFEQIGLGEQAIAKPATSAPTTKVPTLVLEPATITVKILADDNEPTLRKIWEPKLRKRIAEASKVLEQHCGVRLEVVEVSTWKSDPKQRSFVHTLREFERVVKPHPAQLAIGFSSKFEVARRGSHLGVTRWPLHSHILLRERSQNLLEVERVELLVHELGHYLGASHSPEPQSVMRPMLTRGQQRAVGSRIQFDPVNALIIAMVGEEMRLRGVRHVTKLSKPTVIRLKEIYSILVKAMPKDPAASQYLRILDRVSSQRALKEKNANRPEEELPLSAPLVRDTRTVLSHLVAVAEQQYSTSRQENEHGATAELSGDELTNLYVRQAAQVAQRMRSKNSRRALLLALGIFFDNTESLRSLPITGSFVKQAESESERSTRLKVLGKPTMRDRTDLVKHFFVSAHLVVASGKIATASAGLLKETMDSQGGSGFSFVDMAANRAGIIFAERLLVKDISLPEVANGFHVDDFLPTLRGLEEGLSADDLQEGYGKGGLPTIAEKLAEIEQRVFDLPVYDQAVGR